MLNDPKSRFRAVLLDILDLLRDNDRKKLAFLLGDDVERRIRDDPTIGGTLNVFEQLIDRGKISGENFSYLIEAFQAIKCYQAAQSLIELQKHFLKSHVLPDLERDNDFTNTSTTVPNNSSMHAINTTSGSFSFLQECLEDIDDDKISSRPILTSPGMANNDSCQTNNNNTVVSISMPVTQSQSRSTLTNGTVRNSASVYCNRKSLVVVLFLTALVILLVLTISFLHIHPSYRSNSSTRVSTSITTSLMPELSSRSSWMTTTSSTIAITGDDACLLPEDNSCTAATPDETRAAGLGVYHEYPCSGDGCNFMGKMCRLCAIHPSKIGRPFPKCPACVYKVESLRNSNNIIKK